MAQARQLSEADFRGRALPQPPARPGRRQRYPVPDPARPDRGIPSQLTSRRAPTSSRPTPSTAPASPRPTTRPNPMWPEINRAAAQICVRAARWGECPIRAAHLRRGHARTHQPHRLALPRRQPARLPRRHFRPARRGLSRAGQGAGRGRRRDPAGRNHLRHAQRQGGALRHREPFRRTARPPAGDDLRHHHRRLRPHAFRPDRSRRSTTRSSTRGRSASASTAPSAPGRCGPTSRNSRASPVASSPAIQTPACPMPSAATTRRPAEMAATLAEFAANGWVNLLGGCCGSTPAHIKAIATAVAGLPPRPLPAADRLRPPPQRPRAAHGSLIAGDVSALPLSAFQLSAFQLHSFSPFSPS